MYLVGVAPVLAGGAAWVLEEEVMTAWVLEEEVMTAWGREVAE